ncbi:unnamed protein product [Lactuca virosa]|uniref:RRM domain-containing protein n=1 Tax=Lactuca virosa TaxID=75947 RepID=A0AAU9MCP0_9ASTR|nr:unnamed protein product [Lactuca virosa]
MVIGGNGLLRREYPIVTTMFVTNLPDGTRKETVKKIFSRYGSISDIYMATKKDSNKKNFAFVRFKGVQDKMQLEASLQGLKCMGSVLEINVAKFERKAVSASPGWLRTSKVTRKNCTIMLWARSGMADLLLRYYLGVTVDLPLLHPRS